MKKIKFLILILIVAMAFAAVPALADFSISTGENVFQGDYTGTMIDENGDEVTLTKFASIVYGILSADEEVDVFGIEITYYGKESQWVSVERTVRKTATKTDVSGDFGIAFFNLKDGYYSARAFVLNGNDWKDAVYGNEVYFTVGAILF